MKNRLKIIKPIVGLITVILCSFPTFAQESGKVKTLLQELRSVDDPEVASVERELLFIWSQTGSPSADLILTRANSDFAQNKFEAAANRFATVTEMAPDHAGAHLGQARALFQLGYIGPAIDRFERALELDPDFYPALFSLAQVYERLDRDELAFKTYEAVYEIHPRLSGLDEALQRLSASVKGQSL